MTEKEIISKRNVEIRQRRINKPINPYEKRLIRMICQELTNREIAEIVDKSIRTIETDRQILIKKIGCRNAVGVVHYAYKHGLVKMEC